MDGIAANAFAITSAALMGYSFALLLVVRKRQEGKSHSIMAKMLPLFPLIFMFYFALGDFELAKELLGLLGLTIIFVTGYGELREVKK